VYGRQFIATDYQAGKPSGTDDLIAYLSGGALPGVGPATATKLVEAFKDQVEAILDSPDAVEQLTFKCGGVGRKTAEKIKQSWDDQKATRQGVTYLRELGVPNASGQKIAERHGVATVDVVKRDPYAAAAGLGLNFSQLDALAAAADAPLNLVSRAALALSQCLASEAYTDGHIYLPWSELEAEAKTLLSVTTGTTRGGGGGGGGKWDLRDGDLALVAQLMHANGMLIGERNKEKNGREVGDSAALTSSTVHDTMAAAEEGKAGDADDADVWNGSAVELELHLRQLLPKLRPKTIASLVQGLGRTTLAVLSKDQSTAITQLCTCAGIGKKTATNIKTMWDEATNMSSKTFFADGMSLEELRNSGGAGNGGCSQSSSEWWGPDIRCFLPQLYDAEKTVASGVADRATLHKPTPKPRLKKINLWIEKVQETTDVEFSKGQKAAVTAASDAPIVIITGGPGCGKTTVVQAIVKLWCAQGKLVKICAPTGRAAQRIGTIQGIEPSTIHRMLGYKSAAGRDDANIPAINDMMGADNDEILGWSNRFEHNATNPLPANAVLIDEASMLSLPLAAAFFSALMPRTQVVLVGDVDQLPPVGPGSVLQPIIDSGLAPVIDLREIFRQAAESSIITSALAVRRGIVPLLEKLPLPPSPEALSTDARSDALLLQAPTTSGVIDSVVDVVSGLSRVAGFKQGDLQVIIPMRKGAAGSTALNPRLQALLNPPSSSKRELQRHSSSQYYSNPTSGGGKSSSRLPHVFREGDRILQQVNDYDKDVFNGDQGIIKQVYANERRLVIEFPHLKRGPSRRRSGGVAAGIGDGGDSGLRTYHSNELHQLELAYAITVHKAQGGEASQVVLALSPVHGRMLSRRLLYTGLTRAKDQLVLVTTTSNGNNDPLVKAVQEEDSASRFVGLSTRLEQERERKGLEVYERSVFSNEEEVLHLDTFASSAIDAEIAGAAVIEEEQHQVEQVVDPTNTSPPPPPSMYDVVHIEEYIDLFKSKGIIDQTAYVSIDVLHNNLHLIHTHLVASSSTSSEEEDGVPPPLAVDTILEIVPSLVEVSSDHLKKSLQFIKMRKLAPLYKEQAKETEVNAVSGNEGQKRDLIDELRHLMGKL
jgi:ATP-dependent exoDNAse (exonuclease V) alpha subunit